MSESRAAADPYTLEFEAAVEAVDGAEVVLDRTYFYPEGGGQPADRGTVTANGETARVVDVQKREGGVVHTLEAPLDAADGTAVAGAVDPAFRTYCMRAHTASHALYGAGRRLLDDLGYGGFGITEEKVRVDFTTPTEIDDATLVELERLVNRAVWESREVSWETLPKEEALALEDIAFNTKTAEGIEGDTVRVVTIGGPEGPGEGPSPESTGTDDPWDVAACGGTHVSNTREIGAVTVLDRSNPGEGLTRVEFAVGPEGIRERVAEKEAALDAARVVGTRVEDLPDEVARLRDERDRLDAELNSVRDRLVDARIAELREDLIERDGVTWLVGDVEGLDANGLADRAGELAGEAADVVALVSPEGYLAIASIGDVDADAVVGEVTAEFGGGGGGSSTVAQGGGLGADVDDVVAFLRGT